MKTPYQALAEIAVVIHLLFLAFIVLGLPFRILMPGFRDIYDLMLLLGVIAPIMWRGNCPLTILEKYLREKEQSGKRYDDSFLSHYLGRVLGFRMSNTTSTLIIISLGGIIWISRQAD